MNNINDFLVKTDHFCDYIPVVSSITNLIDLFQKCVVLPFIDKVTISSNHYYKHINEKNFVRCLLLIIPVIGNIIVGIYDFRKNSDKSPPQDSSFQEGLRAKSILNDVMDSESEVIKLSLKRLKESRISYSKQFVYLSESQIKEQGGICLTPCSKNWYEGFVASQDNSLWILHICPGGGHASFSEDAFSKMMPVVIKALHDSHINIEAFVIDGRHSEDTKENFEKWQKKIN